MLEGRIDNYNCFHVNTTHIGPDFVERLQHSLSEWRQSVKAVWLHVPTDRLDLVPVVAELGFSPHHVDSRGIMLAAWLLSRPNTLPTYASHYIGAGGLVFREGTDEILVIKAKVSNYSKVSWKLPGGLVNYNESISAGAVREVREETGVETEPLGIVGFRERSKYLFGMGDIYYIVLLRPLSEHITPDGDEVDEAQWMNFYEWLNITELGDARTIIRKALGEAQGHPREVLMNKVLSKFENQVNTATYTNTHTIHFPRM